MADQKESNDTVEAINNETPVVETENNTSVSDNSQEEVDKW
jgi:hypothetical protein